MIAKRIADIINPLIKENYVEPFIGGCSVFSRIEAKNKIGADVHQALITMWQSVMNGWEPPENLSEEEHRELKGKQDPLDPMTAFAGFGCSFGGVYFSGYARNNRGTNFAATAKRVILRKTKGMVGSKILQSSYDELEIPPESTIYCDPPYQGTSQYKGVEKFDHDKFWQWVRDKQKEGHLVFVSEYSAPDDFKVLTEFNKYVTLNVNTDKVVDKLFIHESAVLKTAIEELFHD